MSSFFHRKKKVQVTVPEDLGLVVGLSTIVTAVPCVPQDARAPLSDIIHGTLQKKRKNKEDPLLAELKAITNTNKPLKEALQQAQNAINQFKEKQWQIKGKDGKSVAIADIVSGTANKINQYSTILGPVAQVSPFFPSVVWGAFSMVLKIAINDSEMGEKLIYFINSYMRVSEIYATYWRLHQHSRGRSSQQVRELIGQVEEEIRKFVYAARKYYFNSRGAARRISRSTNVPFSAEFQPICDGIRDLTDYLKLAVDAANNDEQKRCEILSWISKVPYQDAHINKARKRQKNTCGWLRKKEQFLSWMNSSSSRVLWVHGNAGFGKTTLMSGMVDYLQEVLPNGNSRCKHVAYFYCIHDAKETLDTLVILSSILKQLVASFPDITDKVNNKFEQHKNLGTLGSLHLGAIQELIIATIQQASSPLFILIDGLDECDEVIRAELLKALIPLTLNSGPVPSKLVKICIFSRPYDDIREGLENPLEIPILKVDNMDDILTFLDYQIASSRSLETILKKEQGLRSQVIRDLVHKADGMFLWVSLQQMNLCRERDPHSIKHYLQDLPNSENIEESYVRIITHIMNDSPGNRRLAGTVLRWLLCAVRPLSVKELTDALHFLRSTEGAANKFKRDTDEFKRDIVHVCHGLVQIEIHNHVEYFRFIHFSAHQSLYNYFEQQFQPFKRISTSLHDVILGEDVIPEKNVGRDGDEQRVDFTISLHHEMAGTCLKYILNYGLAKGLLPADEVYNCRQEFDLLATEKPFFLYASEAWAKHLHATAGYSADLATICLELFRRNSQNLQLAFQVFWFQKFIENFPRGSTPLHIASYFRFPTIIPSLLEDVSSPFITDNQFRTPIYWAAYHGDYTSLKALGLVTTRDCNQQVLGEALLAAVEGDQVSLITDLLSWGANPDGYARGEKNTLFYATLKGDSNLSVVQQLVTAGAKLEPEAPIASPLQAAAIAGALEIAHYLLSLHVDVNVRSHDPPGLPLKTAVFAGQHDMAELLLKSGADINLPGEGELIELASLIGDPKMLDILLQHSPPHLECSYTVEGEEAQGEKGSPSQALSQHMLPAGILVDTPDPGISNQPGEASVSQIPGLQLSEASGSQIPGLLIAAQQVIRLAKMGNMGPKVMSVICSRGHQMLLAKFEALDFGFIEAIESFALELGTEISRAKPTTFVIQSLVQSTCEMRVILAPKVQTREQSEFSERWLKVAISVATKLIDGGCQGKFREACLNIEKSLLEAVGTQAPRTEKLFAEVEAGMQLSVAMERYPVVLCLNIRGYLAGIMAIMPPGEGIVRFAKFLDGVVVSGLNKESSQPGNWRKMVAFIETANCAYACGYKRLYPQIQLKVALLRKAVKDNPKLNPDGIMLDQLGAIAGGRPDWQWDRDEAPWWGYH